MKTSNNLKKIVFIGGGAHVVALLDFFSIDAGWDVLGYVDRQKTLLDLNYLGTDQELLSRFSPKDIQLVMGIGIDIRIRTKVFCFFKERGYCFVSYIHPSSVVSPTARVSEGCIVFPGVVLGAGVRLEENVCVYSSSVVEHQTEVGAHSYVSPAVAMGGNCKLAERCFLGINSTLIEGIVLGSGVVVGAGAVVLKDFMDEGVVVAGVPARIIRRADGGTV